MCQGRRTVTVTELSTPIDAAPLLLAAINVNCITHAWLSAPEREPGRRSGCVERHDCSLHALAPRRLALYNWQRMHALAPRRLACALYNWQRVHAAGCLFVMFLLFLFLQAVTVTRGGAAS